MTREAADRRDRRCLVQQGSLPLVTSALPVPRVVTRSDDVRLYWDLDGTACGIPLAHGLVEPNQGADDFKDRIRVAVPNLRGGPVEQEPTWMSRELGDLARSHPKIASHVGITSKGQGAAHAFRAMGFDVSSNHRSLRSNQLVLLNVSDRRRDIDETPKGSPFVLHIGSAELHFPYRIEGTPDKLQIAIGDLLQRPHDGRLSESAVNLDDQLHEPAVLAGNKLVEPAETFFGAWAASAALAINCGIAFLQYPVDSSIGLQRSDMANIQAFANLTQHKRLRFVLDDAARYLDFDSAADLIACVRSPGGLQQRLENLETSAALTVEATKSNLQPDR